MEAPLGTKTKRAKEKAENSTAVAENLGGASETSKCSEEEVNEQESPTFLSLWRFRAGCTKSKGLTKKDSWRICTRRAANFIGLFLGCI